MGVTYSDQDIAQFLSEPKALPPDYRSRLKLRHKKGHSEHELSIVGANGSHLRVIVRQSSINALDFSVILAVWPPTSTRPFRLRRHNGRSHEHTNTIEGITFYDFHIHEATQRYQELGVREDWYAEPTSRFASVWDAFDCLLADCSFVEPNGLQGRLLEEA